MAALYDGDGERIFTLNNKCADGNTHNNVVYKPTKQTFDFKLTPKAIRKSQSINFKSDFPGYSIDYIFGPGSWRI